MSLPENFTSYYDRIDKGDDSPITHGWALYELYHRVGRLERLTQPEVVACPDTHAGHPIPEYDNEGMYPSVDEIIAKEELVEVALEYADHHIGSALETDPVGFVKQSMRLHAKLLEAAKKVK